MRAYREKCLRTDGTRRLSAKCYPSGGTGDLCGPEVDADGVLNKFDPCPFTALGVAVDADGRSLGDIDLDCDTDLDDYRLFQLGFNGSSK